MKEDEIHYYNKVSFENGPELTEHVYNDTHYYYSFSSDIKNWFIYCPERGLMKAEKKPNSGILDSKSNGEK